MNTDDNGNVTYATNEKGKAVVARDENGKKVGSRDARKALVKLINSDEKVSVGGTTGLTGTTMDGPNPNLILFKSRANSEYNQQYFRRFESNY